jgi:arginase family enzyme
MERGVFGQRSVGPEFVVVVGIRGQDPTQVRVAPDHDVVQALSPDRADESFDVSILPGRSRRGWSVPNAHGSETSRYRTTILKLSQRVLADGISV